MTSKIEIEPAEGKLVTDSRKLLEFAIEANLKMTYENRIDAHENARELLVDLRQAGEKLRAKSQSSS